MSVDFYALWGPRGNEKFGEKVNCDGRNGRALLDLLGYRYDPSDPYGDDDPDEFLARVHRAKIRVDNTSGADAGIEWTSGRGRLGARWIDGGRREGYFAGRLLDLEQVARDAKRHGGVVCWA